MKAGGIALRAPSSASIPHPSPVPRGSAADTTYRSPATRASAAPKTIAGLGLRHWTLVTETWQLAPEARQVLAKIRKDVFDGDVPKP